MNEVIELIGDLWTAPIDYPPFGHQVKKYDMMLEKIVLIPTNGIVKPNSQLVMGAGVAKQAAQRYPDAPLELGMMVKKYGNHAFRFHTGVGDTYYEGLSWPTKHHYSEMSDLDLICQEAKRIVAYLAREVVDEKRDMHWTPTRIGYAPLVGCGLGGLRWEVVREALAPIVQDRIYFVKPLR